MEGVVSMIPNREFKLSELSKINSSASEIDGSVGKFQYLAKIKSRLKSGNLRMCALGDSITQNTSNADPINKSWFHLVRRALMKEFNADNYGFENVNSKYYPQISYFNSVGSSGKGWDINIDVSNSFTGKAYKTSELEASLYIQPWVLLYKKIRIGYLTDTSDSVIRVEINGSVVETINVLATTEPEQRFTQYYDLPEWGTNGRARIRLYNQSGKLSINGYDFINDENSLKFDNLSHHGRQTEDLSEKVISDVFSFYDVVIFSMGFNDQDAKEGSIENDKVLENLNYLKVYSELNNVPIIFLDFIWGKGKDNYYRSKINELSKTIPNCIYIPFAELIKLNGTVTTAVERDAIGLTKDGTHLTDDYGNFWVASHIAKQIGLQVSKDFKFDTDIIASSIIPSSRVSRRPRDWGAFNGPDPFIEKVLGFAIDGDIYTDISLSPPSRKYYVGSTNTWTVF